MRRETPDVGEHKKAKNNKDGKTAKEVGSGWCINESRKKKKKKQEVANTKEVREKA